MTLYLKQKRLSDRTRQHSGKVAGPAFSGNLRSALGHLQLGQTFRLVKSPVTPLALLRAVRDRETASAIFENRSVLNQGKQS